MSITIIVDGEINISAKKGIEINSGGNIEINTKGKYIVRGEQGGVVYGNNPKNIPPMEVVKTIIKTRLKENYNGEFGFDWLDVNPFSREIEKIQGVDFSNVEYFYKAGNTPDDLGNILSVQGNEIAAKDAVANSYQLNRVGAYVDMPYVLMKKGQEIILQTQVEIYEGELTNDTLSITGDDYFEFELVGGTKTGKRSEIKLSSKEQKIDLKVTCLQEIARQKTYEYKYKNDVFHVEIGVGGLTMMENTTLKLKFRVIALVSNENDPNSKAKALFKKFKEAGIRDYLNKNSLNQAGYEVEIENFDAMDGADVDEYFYAFDKADWLKRNLFEVDLERKKYTEVKDKEGNYEFDIKPQEGQLKMVYEKEIVLDEQGNKKNVRLNTDLDTITSNEYQNKLKIKSKSTEAGLIIISDLECSDMSIAGFSKVFPVNYKNLFIFSNGIVSNTTFAHEIGHMLCLEHIFMEEKEKEELDIKRNEIINYKNERIEKCKQELNKEIINNQISPKDTNLKPLKKQIKSLTPFTSYIIRKKTLNECIKNSNSFITLKIQYINESIISISNTLNDKKEYATYTLNNEKVSKKVYIDAMKTNLDNNKNNLAYYTEKLNKNLTALDELSKFSNNSFFDFRKEFFLLYEDCLKIFSDYLYKLSNEWEVVKSNYLMFQYKSTKNLMDYGQVISEKKDSVIKNRLMAYQILIMRKDYENFK
ncbi:MAG: hypothetical protein QM535_18215 [Limnohabitans sp.]|nr:hypothetical protein [Limnohabitans sp.]